MHGSNSLSRVLAFWLALLASWCAVPPAHAQVRIPAEALASTEDLNQLFEQGARLEEQRRWAEALSHYEHALESYPGRRDLAERLQRAKIHLDLARRYADASYRTSLTTMTERQALDVYSEVLLKIDTHYVDSPDWTHLVRRGTTFVEAAMNEPAFVERNVADASPEQIAGFCDELRRQLDQRVVSNRTEAREAAVLAAAIAARRLDAPPQAVILEYACGAMGALDPYSTFLTSGQLDDVFSQIEGSFIGLGVELKAKDQSLLIVNVIPGGPAAEAGLQGGDRIVAVDGRTTRDVSTDAAADMLKGSEGSAVEIEVVTAAGIPGKVRLLRRKVEVPSVEGARIADSQYGIGYLRLASFQKTTSRDVNTALWRLYRDGMKRLIVDVRGNPGGLLSASVEVADKFISGGAIVTTRGRNSQEDFDYRAQAPGTWRVPLIVLIDPDTASASEIFAGAIHDHHRGLIVGQRSYGKGSVQGIFRLNASHAGVRLTTAKFFSPSGRPISHQGVSPDVLVHAAAKPADEPAQDSQEDPVLESAMQLARQRL